MTAVACALLRHDVRPRFIGDLVAAYCHSCGCLFVPEPITTPRRDAVPQSSGGRVVIPPASPVAGVLQAAATATAIA